MDTTWRRIASLGVLGLTLAMLSGCQTWAYGMTLPSPHYLDHPPQYFAPSPPFPLSNELAQQQKVWSAPSPDAVNGGGLPQQLPVAPIPVQQ